MGREATVRAENQSGQAPDKGAGYMFIQSDPQRRWAAMLQIIILVDFFSLGTCRCYVIVSKNLCLVLLRKHFNGVCDMIHYFIYLLFNNAM